MTYQIRFDKKCRDTWPVWQSPSQQLFVSKNDCEGVYPGTKLRYYAWGGGGGGGGGGVWACFARPKWRGQSRVDEESTWPKSCPTDESRNWKLSYKRKYFMYCHQTYSSLINYHNLIPHLNSKRLRLRLFSNNYQLLKLINLPASMVSAPDYWKMPQP
jgi:hypothetical protein